MQNSFVDSVYFYAFALFCNEADGLYISDGLRVIPTKSPPASRFEKTSTHAGYLKQGLICKAAADMLSSLSAFYQTTAKLPALNTAIKEAV